MELLEFAEQTIHFVLRDARPRVRHREAEPRLDARWVLLAPRSVRANTYGDGAFQSEFDRVAHKVEDESFHPLLIDSDSLRNLGGDFARQSHGQAATKEVTLPNRQTLGQERFHVDIIVIRGDHDGVTKQLLLDPS